MGVFLFLGPTGVGKTETAKALAEFMMGTDDAIVRIDLSEYQEEHSMARLIGAPPGYIGYEEGGQLTEAVRRKPYSVVLLDEVEKAHPNIFNTLLQVFDDGRMTDGKGRVVDFKNTVIIMTSNLATDLVNQTFKPEFINRLTAQVIYKPLSENIMNKIVDIQLDSVRKNLSEQNISISVSEKAKNYLAKKGYDPTFGARPLRRLIEQEILDEIAMLIIDGGLGEGGDSVEVEVAGDSLKISPKLAN
jgi:ATP-dependent Clp protease ATP-binding subunit ClpA